MSESTMSGNPFELSDEEKQKKVDEARDARLAKREAEDDEHFENGTGPYSDGKILDGIGNGMNRIMDGPMNKAAEGAGFDNPDAAMGGLIAGAGEKIRDMRGHAEGSVPPEQPGAEGPVDDTPPIQLRMPK